MHIWTRWLITLVISSVSDWSTFLLDSSSLHSCVYVFHTLTDRFVTKRSELIGWELWMGQLLLMWAGPEPHFDQSAVSFYLPHLWNTTWQCDGCMCPRETCPRGRASLRSWGGLRLFSSWICPRRPADSQLGSWKVTGPHNPAGSVPTGDLCWMSEPYSVPMWPVHMSLLYAISPPTWLVPFLSPLPGQVQ